MWKYYTLRLAYLILGRLPLRALYGVAHVVGDGAFFVRRNARRAVQANMRRLMGSDAPEREVRRAAREVFRNAARYYSDLIHQPRMDVERFYREQFDVEGMEYLRDARDSGRGAVVVGAHFGSPEMASQGLTAVGLYLLALTEPLEPPALSDFIHWLRSQHGHVARTVGYGGIKEAILRLRGGGLVAILLDRDVGGTGVPLRFCGAEAMIPLGGIELALRTGADLIPSWSWRLSGYRFRVRIGPPLHMERTGDHERDVRAAARRVLDFFEVNLRSDPGQWAVLEAIWPARGETGDMRSAPTPPR